MTRPARLPALALVALAASAGLARADDDACKRTVTVTGRAQASQAPDYAEVAVGVEAKGASPAAALDAASKAVAGVVALGQTFGVPPGDIGTAAIVLEPATRSVSAPNGTRRDEPDGYRATNRVTLRLADMARLADLLRQSLETGANRIDSVGFGLNEPDRIEAALQLTAARNARTQAAALAEAVGARLGGLCALSTTQAPQPMPPSPMRAAVASTRVPIVAGTIDTVAEVGATFAVMP